MRAHIVAYGVSKSDAQRRIKTLMSGLRKDLSEDCTMWDPEYQGYSAEVEAHHWKVVVTLGGDKEAAEKVIAQKVGSCT